MKNIKYVRTIMFILVLVLVIFLFFSCNKENSITSPNEELRRSNLPTLQIDGNRILDENGNTIVFRGVNSLGFVEMLEYFKKWDSNYFDKMKEWNVKIVRIPIHYISYKWYEKTRPGSFLKSLDQGIEWAARNGIYSIIDFHSCGWPPTGDYFGGGYDETWGGNIYEFTPEELKSFWNLVSKYFANDTRIAFYDLFNEPAKENPNVGGVGEDLSLETWLEWRNFAEEIIDIIRKNDQNRIVLVGGLQFSYYVNHAVENPVRRPNVIYSVHLYKDTNWQKSWDDAFGNAASQIPILVGEFGVDPDNPSIGGTIEDFANPLLNYLEEKKIGWLAWCFGPEWGNYRLVLDWNYTRTVAGEFFYKKLHELNGAGSSRR